MTVRPQHIQVLKTLHNNGLISRQTMKTHRGKILAMKCHQSRERYLRGVIRRFGGGTAGNRHQDTVH